jgi:hypothetical protein
MKIILLSGRSHRGGSTTVSTWAIAGIFTFFLVGTAAVAGWVGYSQGVERSSPLAQLGQGGVAPEEGFVMLLDQQRKEWQEKKRETDEHLDALALRLGDMQSRLLRLDALGERLTKLGKLDPEEFNFSEPPPRGGIDLPDNSRTMQLGDMVKETDSLARTIEDRELKLSMLEDLIMNRELQKEIRPSGYPVKGGWISSPYGKRKDPFTGRVSFHPGVDIPARKGAPIMAAASGIVSFSGVRHGYGNVVEIRHGNGFATRYAHCSKRLVKAGDTVSKGQIVALVGSTGRSTGPHLHFEVSQNGVRVNPTQYLRAVN